MIKSIPINFEENNHFFKLIFKSIEEGLIITDSKGTIQFLNFRTQELFGYTSEELIGKKIEVLIPNKYHEHHEKYRDNYVKKPSRKTMGSGRVLEGLRKNGSLFYTEISLNYICIQEVTYVVALISDITKRVLAEQKIVQLNSELEAKVLERTGELQESQFLYTAVAQNFPDGIINVFDKDLNYIFAEGKELYNLGITSKKLLGTSYLNRLPTEVRPMIESALKEVFNGSKKDFELNLKKQFYHINAVPLRNEKNEIDKILVVEKNITAQKVISQKLEESLRKEKEINEMKSRFVSMASHEFRTPLSTILSSNSLIDKYLKIGQKDKTEKHIKRIKSAVLGLTDILNDFLSTDKLENDIIQVKNILFDYAEFVEEVTEELQLMCIDDQNIKSFIKSDVKNIIADKKLLKNVLYNLLSNAIKYSKDGQDITFNSFITNKELKIEIKDKGIGIPLADQAQLFTRFYRAENAINIKGTGLGLVIVKSYLNLLHGSIDFKSIENEGTTFTCIIPIENE
ncbi:hybrid sensor histidine kinase/response regulator [Putridiphycobacter roseus]|uniref:histidine kinase n=1 Tax=Putridiphycobacter roseus TaxID=2219161 RepID=A0A2W1MYG2_9FLAO|nr:PAS domain S-box protein [Putridiphycobacter roseus]PZE16424.1 hybrid sensor histidine kinase/response regulator [Putridiphycobacter roseus]